MKKVLQISLVFIYLCLTLVTYPQKTSTWAVTEGNDITVQQVNPSTVYKGEFKLTLELTVLDSTDYTKIKDVTIAIDPAGASSFSVTRSSSVIKISNEKIKANKIPVEPIYVMYDGGNSTKLPIKISYTKETISEETKTSTSMEVNTYIAIPAVPEGSVKEPEPINTSKFIPKLTVLSGTMPSGKPGESISVPLQIKNTSNHEAKNITITPLIGEDSPFESDSLNLYQTLSSISPTYTGSTNFSLRIKSSSASKVYPIKFKFEYDNAFGDAFSSETTLYVKVTGEQGSSKIVIKDFYWNTQNIFPGDNTIVSVKIANIGSISIKDIKLSLLGLKEDGFTVIGGSSSALISNMEAGTENIVEFKISASKKMTIGNYGLSIKLEYKEGNAKEVVTDEQQFFIPIQGEQGSSKLVIKGFTWSKTDIFPGDSTILSIKIANKGSLPLKDVKVSLLGLKEDAFTVIGGSSSEYISTLNAGGENTLNYKITASKKMTGGNHGISIKLEYKEGSSKEIVIDEQQFFIPVQGVETPQSTKTVPKIILNQYSSNPTIVKAGQNFELNMSFLNTSETKAVRNIKIYLTVNESTTEGGSIFTPVNSSNTFFIGNIAAKGTVSKVLTLYTIPDAKQKTYTITTNFEYEDADGNEYKATDLIGIPVTQDTKIETSEMGFPPEAYPGQPFPVSFDFYNTGKTILRNLMIKTEGDFDLQNGSYFVGNLDIGGSDHYEAMVIPRAAGQVQGAVVLTYEDPTGQKQEIRKDFTINVIDMPMPIDPGMDPGMEPGVDPNMPEESAIKKLLSNKLLWSGLGVLVLAVMGLMIRKKIIRKKEGITLDE